MTRGRSSAPGEAAPCGGGTGRGGGRAPVKTWPAGTPASVPPSWRRRSARGGPFDAQHLKSAAAPGMPGNAAPPARGWRGGGGVSGGGGRGGEPWPPSPGVALMYGRHLTLDSLIYIFIFCLFFLAMIYCVTRRSPWPGGRGGLPGARRGMPAFNVPPAASTPPPEPQQYPSPPPPPPSGTRTYDLIESKYIIIFLI